MLELIEKAPHTNKFGLRKIRPLWLREKLYYRLYSNKGTAFVERIIENATLEFAPHVSLKLMPTDTAHRAIASLGFYELSVSRRIAQLAQVGGLMVDVGANYGYYSCLWAAAKDNNRVIAFEASPSNFSALKLNLQRNSIAERVNLHEIAVGKEAGSLPFTLGSDRQTGWGGLLAASQDGAIEVPVVSLDDFFLKDKYQHIDLLKIDTEGADTWVLQGAEKLLRSHKISHIFFEENFGRMSALGIKPGEAQNLLQQCGYYLEKLGEGEWYARV